MTKTAKSAIENPNNPFSTFFDHGLGHPFNRMGIRESVLSNRVHLLTALTGFWRERIANFIGPGFEREKVGRRRSQ